MRSLQLAFAVIVYLIFFLVFLYFVGFMADLVVPKTVNAPWTGTNLASAMIINLGLILLFGLQHSIMARPWFKAALTRVWPAAIERSLYVLATAAALIFLFWWWQPMPGPVWSVEAEWGRVLLWVLFGLGWGIIFLSTWLLSHFELFGLQQAWHHYRGSDIPSPQFRTPFLYRYVRHPLYMGMLLAFWAIPDMSMGHLLFASGMTIYILIGVTFEEQDLIKSLGEDYVVYRQRVGMLFPNFRGFR